MFGWFRSRKPTPERPPGYRDAEAPLVADIDLRDAPRRSRWTSAGYLAMSAVSLPATAVSWFDYESLVHAVAGAAGLLWPVWTASYFWRTRRRVTRLLLRSDGRVTLERPGNKRPLVGRLRLRRRALAGPWGRKRAWDLGLTLDGHPGAVEVLAGHRITPRLLEALEAAGGAPEVVQALPIGSADHAFPPEVELPPPRAPTAPLPVQGRLDVFRGRAVSPFVQSLPLVALGVALVVLGGEGVFRPENLAWTEVIGGSLAFSAVAMAYVALLLRRKAAVTLERAGGEVLLRRGGDIAARLPATAAALGWRVGLRGEVLAAELWDARGNVALSVGRPAPELVASLRGLYEAPSVARVRVAAEYDDDAAQPVVPELVADEKPWAERMAQLR